MRDARDRCSVPHAPTFDGAPNGSDLEVRLAVNAPVGWTYFTLPDPGAGQFNLVRVLRDDGTEVRFGDNVWTTDRTFIAGGRRPKYEHRLHLLDRTIAGLSTYRLLYEPAVPIDLNPPTSHVAALPGSSRPEIPVQWSGEDLGGSGLAFFDVFVAVDGGPFTRWLEKTTQTGALYPGEIGRRYAFNTVATDRAGNAEAMKAEGDTETIVNRANTRPTLILPADLIVPEGATVAFRARAEDVDVPADRFTFALGADAPAGVTLDPFTGRVSWRTGEGNGPSTNRFTVTVTDEGIPALSASGQVTVIVGEVNTPPTLEPPADRVINAEQSFELSLAALTVDPDIPANPLTFSLGPGTPDGMTVDTATGLLRWRPNAQQGPSTNHVEVRVSDGQATVAAAFTLVVRGTGPALELTLGSATLPAGQSDAVPVHLKSGLDLVELAFELGADADRLTDLVLQPQSPLVGSVSLVPAGDGQYEIRLIAVPGQVLQIDSDVAQLDFTTSTGASAILPLRVSGLTGTRAGGALLGTARVTDGRVLILGAEPLLEIASGSGALTVRGNSGDTLVLEHLRDLSPGSTWTPVLEIQLDDGPAILERTQLPEGSGFLRATIKRP